MRPIDVIHQVAPNAMVPYLAAFSACDAQFVAAEITTPLRVGHFLTVALMETGGLTITRENMNYSAPRLVQIFGPGHSSASVTWAEAKVIQHHPEMIAERVYGPRTKVGKELGNTQPGDGFRYRGGGIFQTTGRFNYRIMGEQCGVDFEGHPEWVLSAEHALKPAIGEWTRGHLNDYADKNDILSISRVINVGNAQTSKIPNGMKDRHDWFNKIWPIVRDNPPTFKTEVA